MCSSVAGVSFRFCLLPGGVSRGSIDANRRCHEKWLTRRGIQELSGAPWDDSVAPFPGDLGGFRFGPLHLPGCGVAAVTWAALGTQGGPGEEASCPLALHWEGHLFVQRLVHFPQDLSPGGDEAGQAGVCTLSLCGGRLVSLPGDPVAGQGSSRRAESGPGQTASGASVLPQRNLCSLLLLQNAVAWNTPP